MGNPGFNQVAEMVKREAPGRQHPIFKASDPTLPGEPDPEEVPR